MNTYNKIIMSNAKWFCPTPGCQDGRVQASQGPCVICNTHQCQMCYDCDDGMIRDGECRYYFDDQCASCHKRGCYHCMNACEICLIDATVSKVKANQPFDAKPPKLSDEEKQKLPPSYCENCKLDKLFDFPCEQHGGVRCAKCLGKPCKYSDHNLLYKAPPQVEDVKCLFQEDDN